MAKKKAKTNPNIHQLWPTTVLTKRFAHHQKVNPELLDLFYQHRDNERRSPAQSYASNDDLLEKYPEHTALQELADFIRAGVFEVSKEANASCWQQNDRVKIDITGLWFQIANGYAFHEIHTHGNCSWSGVYYVRSGDSTSSPELLQQGIEPNGITRFYGPHMEHMAGGHGDYGNYYLHESSWDSFPRDGGLAIFPAHLKHMAFPYNGKEDRVIVSFHAQVINSKGFKYGYGMAN